MITISQENIDHKTNNGYHFDFGRYISESINLFSKEWLKFSLWIFVSYLLTALSIITIIGPIVVITASFLGISHVCNQIEKGQPVAFKDFFEGYNKLGQLAVLALIYLATYIALYIPMLLIYFIIFGKAIFMQEYQQDINPFASLLIFAYYPIMYAGIFFVAGATFFAPYLLHYGEFSAIESIKISYKLFKKNWLMIILFILVMGIIANFGFILCIVGIFASLSIYSIAIHLANKDVLMDAQYDEINEIGKN